MKMKMPQVKQKAKALGIDPGKKKKADLILAIQKAEGYATERVNNAMGEATRFNALYREYVKAPEVTKKRLYLETLANVLPKIGNKVITDEKGSNVLPLLQMQFDKK